MGAFSDYMEDKLLDWLAGSAFPTAPTNLYFGLFSAMPGDTGSGGAPSDGTETTGTGYARVSITTSTDWNAKTTAGTARNRTNKNLLTFATPGAGGWGTAVGIGIWDAATTGNLLFYCTQTPNKVINQGDLVTISASALTVQVD